MKTWFSPHGSEWQAETYEEALEQERDALVEQYATLESAARTYLSAWVAGEDATTERQALSRAAYPASRPLPREMAEYFDSTEAQAKAYERLRESDPAKKPRPDYDPKVDWPERYTDGRPV